MSWRRVEKMWSVQCPKNKRLSSWGSWLDHLWNKKNIKSSYVNSPTSSDNYKRVKRVIYTSRPKPKKLRLLGWISSIRYYFTSFNSCGVGLDGKLPKNKKVFFLLLANLDIVNLPTPTFWHHLVIFACICGTNCASCITLIDYKDHAIFNHMPTAYIGRARHHSPW